MKLKLTSLTGLVLSAAAAALIAGCASSGYQKSDQTAVNIQKAATQIDALPAQIDKTLAALNDLVGKSQANLVPQFKTFSTELENLRSQALDIESLRKKMGESGKAFLADWDQQLASIKNEDIKSRSQARMDEVKKQLTSVKAHYAEAANAFRPFIGELQDIQKYLSIDLTTGGIDSLQKTVAKVNTDAGPLKEAILKVGADFKALGVSLSSSAPAPAAK
jgi:hypothetical protein